jgi:hypothetical protein
MTTQSPDKDVQFRRKMEGLLAKQAITEQILRYCRGLDRCDLPLLLSVFHEDAVSEHAAYQGPSRGFGPWALELLGGLDHTHHHVGNILIDLIDESHAMSETYWTAYHRIGAGVLLGASAGDHDLSVAEDLFIAGRYVDSFDCRAGQWKIARRLHVHDWTRWEKADERGFAEFPEMYRGARSPKDASYHWTMGSDTHALFYRNGKVTPVES